MITKQIRQQSTHHKLSFSIMPYTNLIMLMNTVNPELIGAQAKSHRLISLFFQQG